MLTLAAQAMEKTDGAVDAATKQAANGIMATPPFELLDWLVVGGYLLVLAVSGVWLSLRKQQDTDDYFLGGRRMPAWAVTLSVVATALSAATFIGGPYQSYAGDLSYLFGHMAVAAVVAVVVVGLFFIPAYYRQRVTTVYELLETRIGRPAKQASSMMFMVGRVFASGARLFMVAIPAAMILYGEYDASGALFDLDTRRQQMMIAIGALAAVGVFYTLAGGIRSVIFTDVLQLFVFVGAAGAALWLLIDRIDMPLAEMIDELNKPGGGAPGSADLSAEAAADAKSKLNYYDTGATYADGSVNVNVGSAYSLVSALTGLLMLNIAAYGMDQDMTQRMLTCKTKLRGTMSAIGSALIAWPVTALFFAVGLGLFFLYKRPDLLGDAAPPYTIPDDQQHRVFLKFILYEMPAGLKGLLLAGLFAAGLSSLNSALNAMSSTLVSDVYRHVVRDRSPRHYVLIGRMAVVGWGAILAGFAIVCVIIYDPESQTLIDFALGVMVVAYSGLLAVFLTATLTNRGNNLSVLAALLVGAAVALRLDPSFWKLLAAAVPADAIAVQATETEAAVTLADRFKEQAAWCGQIAFPWRMLIATSAATVVCMLGQRSTPVSFRRSADANPELTGDIY